MRLHGARLLAAETDPGVLDDALQLLNEVPAMNRRRLLASYANLAQPWRQASKHLCK
jgi:hypothetical protein